MNTDYNIIVRSPKFYVRKEDKKMFFANKEEKSWVAKDGDRIDCIASVVFENQFSVLDYPRQPKLFKMEIDSPAVE